MPHRPSSHTRLPEDLPLLKALAALTCGLVLLLGAKAIELVRSAAWPQAQTEKPAGAASWHPARPMSPLQWRSPWWASQLLAWAIATLTAPTFLFIGSLLAISSHSDHPLFWWSLPAIVAIGNAVAILWINQLHHREPFSDRQALARRHTLIGTVTVAALFLLVGMVSGFLPDMVPMLLNDGAALPALSMALYSAGLSAVFAILSFPFAGAVHARLGYQMADARSCRSAAA